MNEPGITPEPGITMFYCRLGGPDPLDYISMYYNPGSGGGASLVSKRNSPPHWHYVSCGFSDLHGDGRVHEYVFCVLVFRV